MQAECKHHPLALRIQCRREFVEGQGTLRQIANKNGVPFGTVRTWAEHESWGAARQRWLDRQTAEPPYTVQGTVENAPRPTNAGGDDSRARKLARVELQLEALDNAIELAKSPDDWHKLTTAKQRLFEQWRVLTGVPLPGSKRPPADRPQRAERPRVFSVAD